MKKRIFTILLTMAMMCNIVACGKNESTNDTKENAKKNEESFVNEENKDNETTSLNDNNNETTLVINFETTSNVEEESTNNVKENATSTIKEENVTSNIPNSTTNVVENTTETFETQTTTSTTIETSSSSSIETTPAHTHDWQPIIKYKIIKEGYLKDVYITHTYWEYDKVYHDCEECGYVDILEAMKLYGFEYDEMEPTTFLVRGINEDKIESCLRQCIKSVGTADLSTHRISHCAQSYIYSEDITCDENGDPIFEPICDENGEPLRNFTAIGKQVSVEELSHQVNMPDEFEEYIDHYECSCGAIK